MTCAQMAHLDNRGTAPTSLPLSALEVVHPTRTTVFDIYACLHLANKGAGTLRANTPINDASYQRHQISSVPRPLALFQDGQVVEGVEGFK